MARPLDRFFYPSAKPVPRPKRPTRKRAPLASAVIRMRVLLIGVAMVFSLAAGRAVQVQAIDASAVAAEAADQITVARDIPAFRGEITDRNGEVLVYTEATVTIVADPEMIQTNGRFAETMSDRDTEIAARAPAALAGLLASHVGGDLAQYQATLTRKGSRYAVVARQVSAADFARLQAAMKEQSLIGLYSESAPTRRYPNGTLAANVLGFVNENGDAAGLEKLLDSGLKGTPGREEYETSPNGKIPLGTSLLTPAQNGRNYRTTIDSGLQWEAEQLLAQGVRQARANSGMVVTMNIKTGEILALANFPTFDPNDYGSYNLKDMGNRAITDTFTPGSVQKVLTMAALLDAGLVRSTDVVEIPKRIKSGDHWITDAFTHKNDPEVMYARGVIARSSNIGAITLARRMDANTLREYLLSFGLGTKTGLGLAGEAAGSLPGADMPGYSRDGIAFGGSALAVTAIQEAAAIAAVTNGGIYNPPRLILSETDSEGVGTDLATGSPRRVISAEASKEVRSMMETMVSYNAETGSGAHVIKGFRTGAKTGTSRKVTSEGTTTGLVTSIVGIGPVEDPQILTYVVIDNPRRGGSGASVAGPVYRDVMALALNRYGVKPSTSKSPDLPVYP